MDISIIFQVRHIYLIPFCVAHSTIQHLIALFSFSDVSSCQWKSKALFYQCFTPVCCSCWKIRYCICQITDTSKKSQFATMSCLHSWTVVTHTPSFHFNEPLWAASATRWCLQTYQVVCLPHAFQLWDKHLYSLKKSHTIKWDTGNSHRWVVRWASLHTSEVCVFSHVFLIEFYSLLFLT